MSYEKEIKILLREALQEIKQKGFALAKPLNNSFLTTSFQFGAMNFMLS